jgi:alcohol dehydrogenase class IV
MDALTHAVESYLAKSSHAASEVLATGAIRLIFKYLLRAYQDGADMEARDAMALASFYAGAAFDKTSVGYVHGIAHQLGRVCGTPHGNANAMLLPEVLSAYGECVHQRLADLALVAGVGGEDASVAARAADFIRAIEEMRQKMEMPLKPKELSREGIPDMAKEAIAEAGNLYLVPRYISRSEIESILQGLVTA